MSIFDNEQTRYFKSWRVSHFAAAVAVLALAACTGAGPPNPEAVAAAPKRELTAVEKEAVRAAFIPILKDPMSAQFFFPPVSLRFVGGAADYCGRINSKNGFGGYVGFSYFYARLAPGPGGDLTVVKDVYLDNNNGGGIVCGMRGLDRNGQGQYAAGR